MADMSQQEFDKLTLQLIRGLGTAENPITVSLIAEGMFGKKWRENARSNMTKIGSSIKRLREFHGRKIVATEIRAGVWGYYWQ